jgi:hypothetical protein
MVVTKMALPRRTFLRGVGATLALPLLDAMVPALSARSAAATSVPRLGFVYFANGANMESWTPKTPGSRLALSPTLAPLEAFREQMVVLTGLAQRQGESMGDGNGEHSRASAVWLNGVHPKFTEGADVRAGVTVDQLAAAELGRQTPLASLEIALEPNFLVGNCDNGYSCVYMNTISWRNPTTPLPMENNPRLVFERLFGDGASGAERLARIRRTRSILDAVADDMASIQRTLGSRDRATVRDYFDAVREVERRIERTEAHSSANIVSEVQRPLGIPASYEDHAKTMFDLLTLAYQADITRVSTYMLCREVSSRTYPEIGVSDQHHAVSHHQSDPDKLAQYAKINVYHTQLFAYFLEKLRSTPDGDGTLLDNVVLLYGGGLGDGDIHEHHNLPVLLAGGGAGRLHGGRHLRYPEAPMTNLFVTLLDKVGVRVEKFGDSSGPLSLEGLSDV